MRAVLSIALLGGLVATAATAQIVVDGSTLTSVTGAGGVTTIDGGQLAGANQFHSFNAFNVPAGQLVDFIDGSASQINNVIARVTGGTGSAIDGTLRVSVPDASFVLLNPNGIVVSDGAVIDVGGSFALSTAEALNFSNGDRFSARLDNPGVFSVAPPAAFGFLDTGIGQLTVEGATISLAGAGAGLSLIGGQLALRDAALDVADGDIVIGAESLTVEGGAIEAVAASADAGDVSLGGRRSIELSGDALIASRAGAGGAQDRGAGLIMAADAGAESSVSIDGASLFNENAGALSIAAHDVTLGDVTTNRLDVAASGDFLQQGGLLFDEGSEPRDFRLSVTSENASLTGNVFVFETNFDGADLGADPEIDIEAADRIDVTGVVAVLTPTLRQSAPRPAIKLSADTVSIRSEPLPAAPMFLFVAGADGVDIEARTLAELDNATLRFDFDTFAEEPYGLRVDAGEIRVFDSIINMRTGPNYEACRIAGQASACVNDTPNTRSGRLQFTAGAITIDGLAFYGNTITDYTNGDFSFTAQDGDVSVSRSEFFLQSSEDAGGGPGQLSFAGDTVTLRDVDILVFGDEPNPSAVEDYVLPSLSIVGETITLDEATISFGSNSFGFFSEFSQLLPAEERDRVTTQILRPQAPTGPIVIEATGRATIANSQIGTSGIPSSAAREHDGDIRISADSLALENATLITDIGAADGVLENSGDISVSSAGAFSLTDSTISANTAASGETGDIRIEVGADKPFVVDRSEIFTSSISGERSGGAIEIVPPEGAAPIPSVVLFSSLLEAQGGVQQALLFVDSLAFIVGPDSQTNIGGQIVAPDSETNESEASFDASFLNAADVLAKQCATSRGGEASTLAYPANLGARNQVIEAPVGALAPMFYAFFDEARPPSLAAAPPCQHGIKNRQL